MPLRFSALPVTLNGLSERVLLEAALLRFNAQLKNFTPLRDRLVASGKDANAAYRQIESRRDQVMAELKKLTPVPVPPVPRRKSFRPLRPGAALPFPIAPVSFLPPGNSPWFGYSGSLQVGSLSEGENIIPPGTTGSILTMTLDRFGGVVFGGDFDAGPVDGQPKEYFWLHSWTCLIPFPGPVVHSTFTYSFPVVVEVGPVPALPSVTFCCFVSVGETPDFVGQDVAVNTVDSWPLVTDLDGYDVLGGESHVQRSFVVEGGHVPAVAAAVGVVVAVESGAQLGGDLSGFIDLGDRHGRVLDVGGIVYFRYDPIPPQIKTA